MCEAELSCLTKILKGCGNVELEKGGAFIFDLGLYIVFVVQYCTPQLS